MKRPVLWGFSALVVLGVVLGLVFAVGAWRDARGLRSKLAEATSALEHGDLDRAAGALTELDRDADRVAGRLRGPIPSLVSIVPVAGRSVRTARAVVESGGDVARAATALLPELRRGSFWADGRVNLAALRSMRDAAKVQQPALEEALERAEDSHGWPLPGPLADARRDLIERTSGAIEGIETMSDAVDLSARVLGAQGRRTYFLAFENPSELRGAGGLWGNYGTLTADDGKLALGRFGRVQELVPYSKEPGPQWFQDRYDRFATIHDLHQLPTAPDFPTVATIAEKNLDGAPGIGPVDGTIAIDPIGLQSLLRMTGPVRVEGWPEPIDESNIVDVTLHDAYSHFSSNDDRVAFLGEAALAVWSQFLDADMSIQQLIASRFGDAVAGKHVRLHFRDRQEQKLASSVGAAGELGPDSGMFGLVTQNTAGNKMDFWLHRSLELELTMEADGSGSGTAKITLENRGPASGEPRYVIGPFDDRFERGHNTQFIRFYLPGSATISPGDESPSIASELGLVVAEWDVDIPPGGKVTRTVSFEIADLWEPSSDRFEARVRRQVAIHPDDVKVIVKPPWGKRLQVDDQGVCPRGPSATDLPIAATLRRSFLGYVIGPWARDVECGT